MSARVRSRVYSVDIRPGDRFGWWGEVGSHEYGDKVGVCEHRFWWPTKGFLVKRVNAYVKRRSARDLRVRRSKPYSSKLYAVTTDDSQNEPPDLEVDDDFEI